MVATAPPPASRNITQSRPKISARTLRQDRWWLQPLITFSVLVLFIIYSTFRAFQTVGLAFLFVPNSTLSYSTLPRSLNADATALYSMFRNISGSIGIAVITALGAERLQAHRAYLAQHLTPYDQPYQDLLARHTQTLEAMGHTPNSAHDAAMGLLNQILSKQAAILSYMDLYAYIAIAAFCLVPLTLLFRSGVAGRPGR